MGYNHSAIPYITASGTYVFFMNPNDNDAFGQSLVVVIPLWQWMKLLAYAQQREDAIYHVITQSY